METVAISHGMSEKMDFLAHSFPTFLMLNANFLRLKGRQIVPTTQNDTSVLSLVGFCNLHLCTIVSSREV
jgi:hypothetical protein